MQIMWDLFVILHIEGNGYDVLRPYEVVTFIALSNASDTNNLWNAYVFL